MQLYQSVTSNEKCMKKNREQFKQKRNISREEFELRERMGNKPQRLPAAIRVVQRSNRCKRK